MQCSLIQTGHFFWCSGTNEQIRERCTCRVYGYSIVLSIALLVGAFEWWMGTIAGSTALLGDAVHMVSDSVVYLILLIPALLMYFGASQKQVTYDRWGGVIGFTLLAIVAIGILTIALNRIHGLLTGQVQEVSVTEMILVPLVTLSFSFVILYILKRLDLQHELGEEGHTHDHTHKAAIWHVVADCLASVAVIVAGLLGLFWPTFSGWFDVCVTLAIGGVILFVAIKKSLEALHS